MPPAPAGVAATAGDTRVTLTWGPVAGATSYNVYWSTTPGVTTANGTQIAGAWNPRWKQTSAEATTAQLSAAPAYFNQGAFTTLYGASYPFSLPYSAGLDELRTYLGQLDLPLWQLREALLPLSGATTTQQAAVAAERLQLPPHAVDLTANVNFVPTQVAWGTPLPPTDPVAYVAPVPAFLQAASVTYECLLELLDVEWVQGGLGVGIVGADGTCSTSTMSLAPINADFLDRVIVSSASGWPPATRCGSSTCCSAWPWSATVPSTRPRSAAPLAFEQLADKTKLGVDNQLAFYQDIDTQAHQGPGGTTTTSLYAQVFLNATVTSVAPDPDLAAIATGGTIDDPVLSDHVAAVQPALGVSAADAATLFGLTDNQLTLANLSFIYRVSLLANAAALPISNLITLAELLSPTAPSPSEAVASLFASPAATLEFLSQANAAKRSGLTLDALTYLFTPPSTTALTLPITDVQTTVTVMSSAGFPSANFYVSIGAEVLLVTAVSGAGGTTWAVTRGQQGTAGAAAAAGATVALSGQWPTTAQMTQSDIATALGTVRQAVASVLSASTTLAAPITAAAKTITVASGTGFPQPNFTVAIGSEIPPGDRGGR